MCQLNIFIKLINLKKKNHSLFNKCKHFRLKQKQTSERCSSDARSYFSVYFSIVLQLLSRFLKNIGERVNHFYYFSSLVLSF